MASPKFSSIDDYIASVDATKGQTLKALIDFILTEFPDLESKIAWNVPDEPKNALMHMTISATGIGQQGMIVSKG